MMSIVLIVSCVLGLIMLVTIGVVAFLMMQSGERDVISTAREGWIQRRSDKDEQDW